jgi:hypothetical protein
MDRSTVALQDLTLSLFVPVHLQSDGVGDGHCQGGLDRFFGFSGKDHPRLVTAPARWLNSFCLRIALVFSLLSACGVVNSQLLPENDNLNSRVTERNLFQ